MIGGERHKCHREQPSVLLLPGNPRAYNLLQIVRLLHQCEGVRFQVKAAPV
jgi:hypothetical protein